MSRHDPFHRHDLTVGVPFATRGCPYRFDFCALAEIYERQVRTRPVEAVARAYAFFKGRVIFLWDDNIARNMDYAKGLFRALAPYRRWWSSPASIHAAKDGEFLELAARSGCKLLIGLEINIADEPE